MYRNFDEIVEAVKQSSAKRVLAVAAAEDEAVIRAALHAQKERIAEPIFTGNSAKIKELLRSFDADENKYNIIDAGEGMAAQAAVELVKSGEANILMKGMLETRDMLKPVVQKENALRTGKLMSHVVVFGNLPHYHKLIVSTDGGMVMYPTLEDKKYIIENAVSTMRAIGYEKPKVAVLAAIEKVNPKMKETVEAAELKQMNLRGEIKDCVVEGPISYDVAMSKEIAAHKGFDCPYCGDFDILIVPDMTSGNLLGKCWIVTAGAVMGGIIVGAKAPIVMTSRGSSAEEKYFSIALAALTAAGTK